jgi:hypothetical protein
MNAPESIGACINDIIRNINNVALQQSTSKASDVNASFLDCFNYCHSWVLRRCLGIDGGLWNSEYEDIRSGTQVSHIHDV